ncbi:DUF3895 domain-containing protein [Pseudalkalibacillus hwajinpoensis]|uniref:DUF3895 domain-containing protein n=1 Tax=Guptibacillus hwajinpoensis TaxID=208199 RepID=UPI00325A5060
MKETLTTTERDQLFGDLSNDQQHYVLNYVKTAKKTIFATILASYKGRNIPQGASEQEIKMLLDDWVLIDVIDAGYVSVDHQCECGQALRYQYIVRHVQTGETRHFGIDHLQDHIGLSPMIAKDVINGFERVDDEVEELLVKKALEESTYDIPLEMDLPSDIRDFIELQLPLLSRQEKILKGLIRAHREELESVERKSTIPEPFVQKPERPEPALDQEEEAQAAFDLFAEEVPASVSPAEKQTQKNTHVVGDLSFIIQEAIDTYIERGIESALMICELLIKDKKTLDNRYSTQKPKVYYSVCTYLDSFVQQRRMTVQSNGREDRIYRLTQKDSC